MSTSISIPVSPTRCSVRDEIAEMTAGTCGSEEATRSQAITIPIHI